MFKVLAKKEKWLASLKRGVEKRKISRQGEFWSRAIFADERVSLSMRLREISCVFGMFWYKNIGDAK